MNNLNFNIKNLTEKTIHVGQTFTVSWGYVFRLIDINSETKEAYVGLVYLGDTVDEKIMKYNDIFTITNPSNSENKLDLTLLNIFDGGEILFATFDERTYTQHYSNIEMLLDIPSSLIDGETYTISGKLTKYKKDDLIETPIINEIYLKESGINISNITTDSDGIFIFNFTFRNGNLYEIYYPGTYDVTGISRTLNLKVVEDSTHLLTVTFDNRLPDYVITAFNSISNPVNSIMQILEDNDTINDIIRWEIKDLQLNNNQLIIYLKDTDTASMSIKSLSIWDEITRVLAFVVVGATLGMLIGVLFPVAAPFTFAAGVLLGTLVAIFSKWDAVIKCTSDLLGCIKDIKLGNSKNDPTVEEVNKNAKEFLLEKLKDCEDTYNLSDKEFDACIEYAECMKNVYSNFQEYTQSYLFKDVSNNLTSNANNLRNTIDIDCINPFENEEINCDNLISCIIEKGDESIAQGDTIIYNNYGKDSPYVAPWEDKSKNNTFGNLILYGGLAAALILYITRKR